MRSSFCFVAALVLTICSVSGVSKKNSAEPDPLDPQELRGAYLGQQPPGLTPAVFAASIISTNRDWRSGQCVHL